MTDTSPPWPWRTGYLEQAIEWALRADPAVDPIEGLRESWAAYKEQLQG